MRIDELHCRLEWALRDQQLNEWETRFARSFVTACRRGRNVSNKQITCAAGIVATLIEGPLIEEDA